jgi:hypothetical protein
VAPQSEDVTLEASPIRNLDPIPGEHLNPSFSWKGKISRRSLDAVVPRLSPDVKARACLAREGRLQQAVGITRELPLAMVNWNDRELLKTLPTERFACR